MRVAVRHGLESVFVTDGGIRPPRDAVTSGKRLDARCRPDSAALRVAPRRPPAASRPSTVVAATLFGPLLAARPPGRDAGRDPGEKYGLVIVGQGADAADDWIAARAGSGDIAVTADVPLAARCVENGALALKPNGEVLDEKAIGMALATRDLMTGLRETGEIGGGPRPFGKRDRSRFLNALERAVQSCKSGV